MQKIAVKDYPSIGRFLRLASVYHILLGLELMLDPNALFFMAEIADPSYPFLMRGVGVAILNLGIGFGIATLDAYRYWIIGLLAFISKILSLGGLIVIVATGGLPYYALWFTLLNHLIWLPFLYNWLNKVFLQYEYEQSRITEEEEQLPQGLFEGFEDQHAKPVEEIVAAKDTLIVFLRHFGCTFCREAMAELAEQREQIEASGTHILVIHQSSRESADAFFAKYGLKTVQRVSDTEKKLYEAFELKRAKFEQVFGWKSWLRGVYAGVLKGHWVGREEGDGWQMPGAFLVRGDKILRSFRHKSAADRVDFCELAEK